MVTCSKYIKLGSGVECCLGIDELCRCLLFDRWAEIRCSSTGEWTFFVRLTQVEKPTLGWLCGTNTFAHILTHTFTLHTNTNMYDCTQIPRHICTLIWPGFVYMYISLYFTHILSKHYYSTSAYGYIQQMHKYSYAYGRCVCMREKLVRNDLFFVECAVNIHSMEMH